MGHTTSFLGSNSSLSTSKTGRMIGVELFSGAGGMSVGASMAGIDIKLAVELDKYAAETYKFNHPQTEVFNKDIRKVRSINIPKSGKPTILLGGPPCQGFSISNQKTRTKENSNNWLFKEFIRLAKQWQPDWVVMENVSGMYQTEDGLFLDKIVKSLIRAGYKVNYKLLNACDFGVPQKRERLFIVGSLHGITFEFPEPLNSKFVTVKEALEDLPCLENGASTDTMPYKSIANSQYARRLRGRLQQSTNHFVTRNAEYILKRYTHIPQGGNWQNIPNRLMKNYKDHTRCHLGIYRRLKENQPSVVIGNYRKNMLIHPTEDRGLSVREAARLQSFPDSYKFSGPLGEQQQQVGNAVPPYLAKKVFEKILRYQ